MRYSESLIISIGALVLPLHYNLIDFSDINWKVIAWFVILLVMLIALFKRDGKIKA